MSAARKIKAEHPFMDRELVLSFANGVVDVLKMMAQVDANFEKPFAAVNWKSPTELSVHLALNSDPYKGKIVFHFDKTVAQSIIEQMTGSEVSPSLEEILDGVGEISNMFYGAAKTKLNMVGFQLAMTLPVPVLTKNLPVYVTDTTSMVIPFRILEKLCYVEIIIVN